MLWENLLKTSVFFNRCGDTYPLLNIPGHRILDDVTGTLFLLGLVWALFNLRKKDCFYAVSGFFVMTLPGLLSADGPQSARILGALPFVALLAAFPIREIRIRASLFPRRLLIVVLMALALSIVLQNGWTYFSLQNFNPECRKSLGIAETWVGENIRADRESRFCLTPRYFQHPSVLFLAHEDASRMELFQPDRLPEIGKSVSAIFVMEGRKTGLADFLRTVFPGGEEICFRDQDNRPLVRTYRVPPGSIFSPKRFSNGLWGEFYSSDPVSAPRITRWDPVIDFSFRGDYPSIGLMFGARWTAFLEVPEKGTYELAVLTTGNSQLWLDGREIINTEIRASRKKDLTRGRHLFELKYQSPPPPADSWDSGAPSIEAPLSLVWKKPGMDRFEVIPNSAFRLDPKKRRQP